MIVDPSIEIGEDYTGSDLRHHQVGEVHTFNNTSASRIFTPNNVAFYTANLSVVDTATNKPLVRDVDFKCSILDDVATSKSGQEVCGIIEVINPNVGEVVIDYQFVGGIHSTGYFLLRQMVQMYPEAINNVIGWDEGVLQKPTTFDPAFHRHNVHQIFDDTNAFLIMLERLRCSLVAQLKGNLNDLYDLCQARFDNMYKKVDGDHDAVLSEIQNVFNQLKIQGEEYILTDDGTNPNTTHGYGNWVQVTDAILYGSSNAFVVGTGTMMDMNSEQVIRNTYIWKNIESNPQPSFLATLDNTVIREGDSITCQLTTTNVPSGTILDWVVVDSNAKNIQTTYAKGSMTVGDDGAASASILFGKDNRTDGNKHLAFIFKALPQCRNDFVVMDTTEHKVLTMQFNDGQNRISTIASGGNPRLTISTIGYDYSNIYLQWGGIDNQQLLNALPTMVTLVGQPYNIDVGNFGGLIVSQDEVLTVSASLTPSGDPIASATITVENVLSSLLTQVMVMSNGVIVQKVDEGSTFNVRVQASGSDGRSLSLKYNSNRDLSSFTGLVSTVQPNAANNYTVDITITCITDANISTIQEWLNIEVWDSSKKVASTLVNINDSSKNPIYQSYFSSNAAGTDVITQVNEGDDFYHILTTPSWQSNGATPSNEYTYTLGDATISVNAIGQRVIGNLPGQLLFGPNNTAQNVQWIAGKTISIKYTAVANQTNWGDTTFTVKTRPVNTVNWAKNTIQILNTSLPTIQAKWSTSNTTLSPISTINDLLTPGLNNTCYLWFTMTGTTVKPVNFKVDIASGSAANFVPNTFPMSFSMTSNQSKLVSGPIVINSQNIVATENPTFGLTNTDNNRIIGAISLIVTANSPYLPITVEFNNINNDDYRVGLSQQVPFKVKLTSSCISTTSTQNFKITYADGSSASDRFDIGTVVGNTVYPDRNYQYYVITPKPNNRSYPNNNFVLEFTTYGGTTADPLTNTLLGKTRIAFKLLDDGFVTNTIQVFSDPQRTIEVNSMDEGVRYYGRSTVTGFNQSAGYLVGNPYTQETPKNATDVYVGSSQNLVNMPISSAVAKRVYNDGLNVAKTPVVTDFTIDVVADRKTNLSGQGTKWVRLASVVDASAYGYTSNVGFSTSNVNTPTRNVVVRDYPINDTSKTCIASASLFDVNGSVKNQFKKGDNFKVRLSLSNATLNDQYYIQLTPLTADQMKVFQSTANNTYYSYAGVTQLIPITMRDFSYHEFGIPKNVTVTNTWIEWNFTLASGFQYTGDRTFTIDIVNATTNQVTTVQPAINLIETIPTPTANISYQITAVDGTVTTDPSAVQPNSNVQITVTLPGYQYSDAVRLRMTSGDWSFSSSNVGQYVTLSNTPDGSGKTATFYIQLNNAWWSNKDLTYMFALDSSIGNLTGSTSFTVKSKKIPIGINRYEWRDSPIANSGNIISSITDYQTAFLHVYTTGGNQIYYVDAVDDQTGYKTVGRKKADFKNYVWPATRYNDNMPVVFPFMSLYQLYDSINGKPTISVTLSAVDTSQNYTTLATNISLPANKVTPKCAYLSPLSAAVGYGGSNTVSLVTENGDTRIERYKVRAGANNRPHSRMWADPTDYWANGYNYNGKNAFVGNGLIVAYIPFFMLNDRGNVGWQPNDDNLTYYVDYINDDGSITTYGPYTYLADTYHFNPTATARFVATTSESSPSLTAVTKGSTFNIQAVFLNTPGYLTATIGVYDPSGNPIGTPKNFGPFGNFNTSRWVNNMNYQVLPDDLAVSAGTVVRGDIFDPSGKLLTSKSVPVLPFDAPSIDQVFWSSTPGVTGQLKDNQLLKGDNVYLIAVCRGVTDAQNFCLGWTTINPSAVTMTIGTISAGASLAFTTYDSAKRVGIIAYQIGTKDSDNGLDITSIVGQGSCLSPKPTTSTDSSVVILNKGTKNGIAIQ